MTYTADDQNGFRVSASNLPQPPKNDLQAIQDTPEVAAAKKNHLEELQKSQLRDQANNYQSNILSYNILPPYFSFSHLGKGDEKNLAVREIAVSNYYITFLLPLRNKSISPNIEMSPYSATCPSEDPSYVVFQQTTKSPFLLSRSEADKIEVPKPDPSLAKLSTLSPPLVPGNQRKPEELHGNSLQIGKLVSLNGIQKSAPLPASFVVPVLPYRLLHSALHHTQDSLGQYDYTYAGDSSAKTESRSLDGTTRGAYSYIDPNGVLQQVHYVADHNGFRVVATNLPEAK